MRGASGSKILSWTFLGMRPAGWLASGCLELTLACLFARRALKSLDARTGRAHPSREALVSRIGLGVWRAPRDREAPKSAVGSASAAKSVVLTTIRP